MIKYVLKRIALMLMVFLIITSICFVLVKLLPTTEAQQFGKDAAIIEMRREKLGYNKPIIVQYGIFLQKTLLGGDWGVSEKLYAGQDVWQMFVSKLPATMLVNVYTMIIGKIGTMELRSAWRTVACPLVRPFVLARSIYSPVKTSQSSALVYLARPAMVPKPREMMAGTRDTNISQVK